MTLHDDLWTEIKAMSVDELRSIVFDVRLKKEDRRLREKTENADLAEAEKEMRGEFRMIDRAEIPTVLDRQVRVETDDGRPNWVERDDASPKQHIGHQERKSAVYRTASGIADRKADRVRGFLADNPLIPEDKPIGPVLWQDQPCAICGLGWRTGDPFEEAHDISVKFGGGDGTVRWAHRSCNRAEGVG